MTINSTLSPYDLFQIWLSDATSSEPNDPTAACLATVDDEGFPNARMVLVRIMDRDGFVFFTNASSRKGQELLTQKKAALCFHWKSLRRQIRIQGEAAPATDAESDAYFASRPRFSRIGAWASLQSQPLASRDTLMERVTRYEHEFHGLENPPRPAHWHGFRIHPHRIEFWKEGDFRLHDRLLYMKNGRNWKTSLLYP